MREGWEIKTIAEATQIIAGGTPKTSITEYWDGGIAWITPADLGKLTTREVNFTKRTITNEGLQKSSAKLFPAYSVILSTRAPIGHLAINTVPMATNQGCRGIVPNNNLDNTYLYYFIKTNVKLLNELGTGTTFKELSTKALGSVKIPIPPLQEQQQIVAILDQAFEAIDQAKANIEKNIANTKELFQSKLNAIFSQKGDGWEEKKFSELFKLKSGDGLTAKNMCEGLYPVYGGNGIAGYHNNFNKNGKYLIIGRVGALCGNVRFLDEKFWLTDNAFQISEMKVEFDYRFLTYLLNAKDLRSHARQAAQPVISNSSLKDVLVSYPSNTTIQKEYSDTLILLEHKIEEIENTYKMKILELNDLKKSILQKAFAGELTNAAILQQVAEPEASYSKK